MEIDGLIYGAIIFAAIMFLYSAVTGSGRRKTITIPPPVYRTIKVRFLNPATASVETVKNFLDDTKNCNIDILLKYIELAEQDPDTPAEIIELIKNKLEWVRDVLQGRHK